MSSVDNNVSPSVHFAVPVPRVDPKEGDCLPVRCHAPSEMPGQGSEKVIIICVELHRRGEEAVGSVVRGSYYKGVPVVVQ